MASESKQSSYYGRSESDDISDGNTSNIKKPAVGRLLYLFRLDQLRLNPVSKLTDKEGV